MKFDRPILTSLPLSLFLCACHQDAIQAGISTLYKEKDEAKFNAAAATDEARRIETTNILDDVERRILETKQMKVNRATYLYSLNPNPSL
jgi:hypothetical protein